MNRVQALPWGDDATAEVKWVNWLAAEGKCKVMAGGYGYDCCFR